MIRPLLFVFGGAVLAVSAYAAGRMNRSAPEEPRPHRGHDHDRGHVCAPPEPLPAALPEEKDRAAAELRQLQVDLKRAVANRAGQLNELQTFLSANLAEGKIAADQILEMFRTETDAAVLDLLQGVLSAQPDAADQPGVLDAFLRLAQSDPDVSRRQAAAAFLGSAWDKDGRVRETLLGIARAEGELDVRLTALGSLASYVVKNADQAGAVNAALLEIARANPHEELRTQALNSIEIRSAGEGTVRQLCEVLKDPSASARLAAADKLGDAPPGHRREALAALEGALLRETEPGLKPLLLANLVKSGRTEALDALQRAAARDPEIRRSAEEYAVLLRKGYADWADLSHEKAKLEFDVPK